MGMISRRQEGEPIAYIRGSAEFYGRTFTVNESVLVPRPESETMIDLLKELHREDDSAVSYRIADVGSGSGALGLSAYLELPRVALDLYDIDRSTLEVAKNNARIHHVAAHTYCSDLLTDSHGPYDIILANLPYVPLGYPINLAAKYEPSIALFAGKDGLDLYRTLFSQLETFVWKPKELYTESLIESHKDLYEIALSHGYRLIVEKDLIQVFSPS
jgi:release factor glutamine methyltransferase